MSSSTSATPCSSASWSTPYALAAVIEVPVGLCRTEDSTNSLGRWTGKRSRSASRSGPSARRGTPITRAPSVAKRPNITSHAGFAARVTARALWAISALSSHSGQEAAARHPVVWQVAEHAAQEPGDVDARGRGDGGRWARRRRGARADVEPGSAARLDVALVHQALVRVDHAVARHALVRGEAANRRQAGARPHDAIVDAGLPPLRDAVGERGLARQRQGMGGHLSSRHGQSVPLLYQTIGIRLE